jgi:acyl carrier protein
MTTLQTLQDILVKDYRLKRDQVTPDAVLTGLGLDSLSVLELMFKIEDNFHLKIADDTPTDLLTVSDVVRYVDTLIGLKEAGAAPSAARSSG